jgi:REP element-mobilizing transposase RayT
VGAIVQNFKSVSSRLINREQGTSGRTVWQRSFYEHVIRDHEDLTRIREYISGNPARWDLDEENPRGRAAHEP